MLGALTPGAPGAADAGADPRAAASGARRRAGRDAARPRPDRWRSARRARRSAPTPTSISPTRSARWGSGTGSPRSASSAARWSTSAGTTRSSRRCSAAPSCTARTCATSLDGYRAARRPRAPRCWCARRPSSAEALVATHGARPRGRDGRRRLGGLQRGRRGDRRGARGDRRSARPPALMRAPGFWANPPERPGSCARLLAPLAWLWAWATRRRLARGAGARLGVPVICVGNLTAGGAGKTPTVIALVERLRARGVAVAGGLARHGGSLAGAGAGRRAPARRRPRSATSRCCSRPSRRSGSARDRAAAGRAAVAAGAAAVVMDDGFQNPALAKDLVDRRGRRRLRLRQRPGDAGRAAARAGRGRAGARRPAAGDRRRRGAGAARCATGPRLGGAAGARRARCAPLRDRDGLARACARSPSPASAGRRSSSPRSAALGAELVAAHGFADHAPYDAAILARLEAEAKREAAPSSSPPRRTRCACRPPSGRRCWCCRSGSSSTTGRRSTRRSIASGSAACDAVRRIATMVFPTAAEARLGAPARGAGGAGRACARPGCLRRGAPSEAKRSAGSRITFAAILPFQEAATLGG